MSSSSFVCFAFFLFFAVIMDKNGRIGRIDESAFTPTRLSFARWQLGACLLLLWVLDTSYIAHYNDDDDDDDGVHDDAFSVEWKNAF